MTNVIGDDERGRATAEFVRRVHDTLISEVPTASEMPVVYVGSGGDLKSVLQVTGADKVILVDKRHFLTQEVTRGTLYDSVEEIVDSLKEVQRTVGSIASGRYLRYDRVRPARHALNGLMELGVNLDDVDVQLLPNGGAKLGFELNGRHIDVDYHYTDEIRDIGDFLTRELGIRNGHYGLMVKAGQHLGREVIYFVQELEQRYADIAPAYIISDDPRSYLTLPTTDEYEASHYPGYSLHAVVTHDMNAEWGYALGRELHDFLPPQWQPYGARAVVCVREPSEPNLNA